MPAVRDAERRVAVLDAGSQYGGLIDRNVRELGIRTSLLALDTSVELLADFDAIIITGGPKSVHEADAYRCDPRVKDLDVPVLGICYGMQLLAELYGGEVGPGELREDGPAGLQTFVEEQMKVWGAVVRENNIKADS